MRLIRSLLLLVLVSLGTSSPALAQDLVATSLTAPLVAPVATSFQVTVTVENIGAADAGPFVLQIFGDDSPGVTREDQYFGGTVVPGLAASATQDLTFMVRSPGSYREAVYYLAVRVDADRDVTESNEDNNWLVDDTDTMTFTATADLTVRSANIPASEVAGGLVTLRTILGNEGTAPSCCFAVGVYLSDNDQVTTTDTLIYEAWIDTIQAGEGGEIFFNFVLPEDQALGTYQLGILVDNRNLIDELDETNNGFSAPFQVRNPTRRIAFVTPPRVTRADICSPAIRVQVQDLDGTPAPPATDLKVNLFRLGSVLLYSDPYCTQVTRFAVLDASSNLATFFVGFNIPGRKPVRAIAPGYVGAVQTQLIIEDPDDGSAYLDLAYTQRSKKVVAGQAARLELTLTVTSELALEEITLQPEHVGLGTLSIDKVSTTPDGSVIVGAMQPGEQRTFVIEAIPELGRLTAKSLVVAAFGVEGSDAVFALRSPEIDLTISGTRRGLGAECASPGPTIAGAWLMITLLGLACTARRRGR